LTLAPPFANGVLEQRLGLAVDLVARAASTRTALCKHRG